MPGGRLLGIGIGVVVLVGFLVLVAGARLDSATTGLVLVALALLACLRALHQMVGALGRDDVQVVVEGEGEFGGSSRREFREERRRLLRAINELRFDHEMGKLSAADYETVREGYELRLVEVMRALDAGASLHPELAKRLGLAQVDAGDVVSVTKADDAPADDAPVDAPTEAATDAAAIQAEENEGAPPAPAPDSASRATVNDGISVSVLAARATVNDGLPSTLAAATAEASTPVEGVAASRVCAACDGTNDSDARFCKHCGKELAA